MTSNRTARFCTSDSACLLLPSADAHRLRQALERVDNLSVLCRLCHSPHKVKWSSIESLGLEELFKGIYGDLHASSPAAAIAVVERVDGRVAILGTTGRPESKQKHCAHAWVPSAFIYETHATLASIDQCTKELREGNEACGLLDEEIAEASVMADRSIRIARALCGPSARAQRREANGQNKAEFDRQAKMALKLFDCFEQMRPASSNTCSQRIAKCEIEWHGSSKLGATIPHSSKSASMDIARTCTQSNSKRRLRRCVSTPRFSVIDCWPFYSRALNAPLRKKS